jgi:inner membrane protein
MDNLTHSLIGLVAGEAAARLTPATRSGLSPDTRRGMLVTLATVGGNLPDIDLVLTYRGFARDKLGYLLEHRGYTHTVLGCLVLAVLLLAAVEGWARYRRLSMTRADHLALAAMAIFGTLLHLGMDALNSYGVHPFWPFYNGWLYGDSVFIVEPLYWLAAAPLFFTVRTTGARVVIAIAALLAIVASALMSPGWIWLTIIILAAACLLAFSRRSSPRTTALTSALATLCVTAVFLVAGHTASRLTDSVAARDFPGDRIIDHVLTPTPTNPFCWDMLLLETRGDRYIARHGMLSDMPGFTPARSCPTKLVSNSTTAPMTSVQTPDSREVVWFGEFSMPAHRLAELAANNCEASALMQFVRAPFAIEDNGGWIIGDLRFDRERGLGLAELEIPTTPAGPCLPRAPWLPPRAALLLRRH